MASGSPVNRVIGSDTSLDTDENSVFTVSDLVGDDRYGQEDVCLSLPSIINRNGILRHIAVSVDEAERGRLHAVAQVLKETARRTIDG